MCIFYIRSLHGHQCNALAILGTDPRRCHPRPPCALSIQRKAFTGIVACQARGARSRPPTCLCYACVCRIQPAPAVLPLQIPQLPPNRSYTTLNTGTLGLGNARSCVQASLGHGWVALHRKLEHDHPPTAQARKEGAIANIAQLLCSTVVHLILLYFGPKILESSKALRPFIDTWRSRVSTSW